MSNQYNPLDDVPWQIRTQNPLQSSPAFSVVTDSLSPERFPQSQLETAKPHLEFGQAGPPALQFEPAGMSGMNAQLDTLHYTRAWAYAHA